MIPAYIWYFPFELHHLNELIKSVKSIKCFIGEFKKKTHIH